MNEPTTTDQPTVPAEVREKIQRIVSQYDGLLVTPAGDYAVKLHDELCAALAPFFQKAAEDNFELRAMCATASAGTRLYHDDGELQDNTARPFIDWKRDSISEIQSKLLERKEAEEIVRIIRILTRARQQWTEAQASKLAEKDAEIAHLNGYVIPEKDKHGKYWHDLAQERIVAQRNAEQRAETAEAQLARLQGQTRWQCQCGGTDCEGQKENERLRAECERLKEDGQRWHESAAENAAWVADLRSQLAAAQVDSKRMDWLETQKRTPFVYHGFRQDDGSWNPGMWMNPYSGHARLMDSAQATLRASIDKARGEG